MVVGVVKTFTCPVDGNPKPNIEWYSEKTGRKISSGKQYKTGKSGCYSCVARSSLGTPVNITHCLTVGKSVLVMRFWPFGQSFGAFNQHYFNFYMLPMVLWFYDGQWVDLNFCK